jgi:hypothetical protein
MYLIVGRHRTGGLGGRDLPAAAFQRTADASARAPNIRCTAY